MEQPQYDHAYLRISTDMSNWTTIWENAVETTDDTWQQFEYDISAVADGEATVYLRWVMGTTDSSWQYSGWNLDDVEIWGVGSGSTPLASPQNVEIAVSSGVVSILFDEVSEAVSYKIYGCPVPDGTFTLLSGGVGEFLFGSGRGLWLYPATGHSYRYFHVTASDEAW